ncbi:MAG: DUF177 domain-containing protein [Balneolales bacterium]
MISFRLNEIPEGLSEKLLSVDAKELDIEQSEIRHVHLNLRFNKKQDIYLRIECRIVANATFKCDRSLDVFETELDSHYEVVFQKYAENEREDHSGTLRRLDPSHNVIDITKELRDTVLLSVPIKKLHPRYFNDGIATEFEASFGNNDQDQEHDPRWDALTKLKQQIQKN